MDPNLISELYNQVSAYLSPAAQAIIVAALALIGVQVGRTRSKSRAVTKPPSSSGQVSPGQFGPGATRDMTSAEIRKLRPEYSPRHDADPDPGEVVWTWVPYVEHDGRGKDRPVLILARISDSAVAGCYLSTKDHDGYVLMGSGAWDPQGRDSYLNPARVLVVSHDGMRREGAQIPKDRFNKAVEAVQKYHRADQ